MDARRIGRLVSAVTLLLMALVVLARPSAAAPDQAAPATLRYGVFDDGNLYSLEKTGATVADLKAHGLDALMLSNGTAAQINAIAGIVDALGGISLVAGPAAELNAKWWENGPRATLANAHALIDPLADQLKGHPSLEAYYLTDEPEIDQAERVALAVRAFAERDPGRPAVPLLVGLDRVGPIYDASRPAALLIDVYPIGTENGPCNLSMTSFGYPDRDMVSYIRDAKGARPGPLWMVLQTHGLADVQLRQPRPEELRLEHWIALGEDAKAIYWFAYSSQPGRTGLRDNPALYAEVTSLAGRLSALRSPLAAAHKVADRYTAGPDYVSTLQSADGRRTYLLLANRSCEPSQVQLSGPDALLRNLEDNSITPSWQAIPLRGGDGGMFEVVTDVPRISSAPSGPSAENGLSAVSTGGDGSWEPAPGPAGVPALDPDFNQDVESWWAHHPFNPDAAEYAPRITSSGPRLDVLGDYQGDVWAAYAALPPTGGTLYFRPGDYQLGTDHPAYLSNVHWLGEPGAVLHGSLRLACGPEALVYAAFNLAVDQQRRAGLGPAWQCVTSGRVHNIYFHNLTFQGQGEGGPWAAVNMSAARDIVFDGVEFRGYPVHPTFHMGLVNGNARLDNIWFLNCRFVGPERWATYLDGCHGCGVVGSTAEGSNFGSGVWLFLTNDDFTYDYNRNGSFDPDEERSAQYTAIWRNTVTGYVYQVVSDSGGHAIFGRNRLQATYNPITFSARCSQKWASQTALVYQHEDLVVRDNLLGQLVEDGALGFARFESANHNASCFDLAHWGTLGGYSVTGNAILSARAGASFATEVAPVVGPKVVERNCLNCADPGIPAPPRRENGRGS